ncbi:unnamed protein product [Tilletia controversa]|uniref:Uncharacterized protein n=3 Tax=Tilletia TaxID=13289 RepID=A0A8X7SXU7_9BASI|nr:hypothetical protein CF328_g5079 [Tilletia controversa]KAE8201426.1 hypothetical protein CF336_g207 [Tilletia laevis]KAE8262483.1 hypothetical protein A4X03_0g2420 [Tilletia caries]KAE8207904.1 hypothetical protein CF335_g801 [Tilletia laevis]KAE8249547.1 hypothetical protein A4X06_0g3175 [Tilletia controversa]
MLFRISTLSLTLLVVAAAAAPSQLSDSPAGARVPRAGTTSNSWFQMAENIAPDNSTGRLFEGGNGNIANLGGTFSTTNGLGWNASAITSDFSAGAKFNTINGGYNITQGGIVYTSRATYLGKTVICHLSIDNVGKITASIDADKGVHCADKGGKVICT